jgi:hypothetical protein
MSASFDCARSGALLFLERIMTQISKICKEYVEKSPKRAEFRAFGDPVAHPRLRHPTAAPAQPRSGPKTAKAKREYRSGDQTNAQANPYTTVPSRWRLELS